MDMLPILEQMHGEATRHRWAHVTMSLADLGLIIQQLKAAKSQQEASDIHDVFSTAYSKHFSS